MPIEMNRRQFLQTGAAAGLACAAGAPAETTSARPLRYGFNLQQKFGWNRNEPFAESDFALLHEWGFNFVRLPMSYKNWIEGDDWHKFHEPTLKEIDDAVALGKKYGIHVCINFHRAPGYCVGEPKEATNLWKDAEPLEACAFHWAHFAKRYQGVPNEQLSFNLINEPSGVVESDYVRVVTRLVEAIRAEDPQREIVADGLMWGKLPVRGLIPLKISQSTRGYEPMVLTHYKASWVEGTDKYPVPVWPPAEGPEAGRARLRKITVDLWKEVQDQGVPLHVGEWGVFSQTPHAVALAWMKDQLEVWKAAGWGWALWELNGSFGVLNSGRADVAYEDFRGQKLDRKMLELLRSYAT